MPPIFLEKVVIFRFDRRYTQADIVARLKSNIFGPRKKCGLATPLSHCIAASPVKDV